ncbi:putative nucleic acid-binding protein [Halanaerobium saccharolyticum]|uniref:Putative nucleic acid-binding protein n=1 Tax=Halanaerobium saccharolyticum TaxID=43595 RepID=A0A4R7ZAJ1_9FIRM|nr:type II toxin-antitoxin system VapC family toxin [Halanaerobium saccharolyticum]RAK11241.1 putative nucleic acid-binding protein [Halanaerobium saccharolyticum]TDW07092.1 putative nucleic acid-binding protein [Halanaerobium saccharolyticum]TDX63857.1 putative nucleic acid-binding protein [Halanaerobium saccharolyticum]
MRITIDVSAAVEIVMGGKRQQEIINILNEADWVIAPSLFIYEASNTLWKYHEYQDYSKEDIMKKIDYLYKMVDQFIDAKDIFEEALPLSCKISHPAYDAMYLVTSRRKNAPLVTLDKRLVRAAKSIDVPVAAII